MLEIRWHGRGGQGNWSASQILAAAAISVGKYVQSFPEFGPERTGAPVRAFNRISDGPIYVHAQVYEPDAVVVIDPSLLKYREVILAGLKKGGHLLVNSPLSPGEVRSKMGVDPSVSVWSVDATTIALEEIGRAVTNTPMAGALVRALGVVPLEALFEAIRAKWSPDIAEKNIRAVKRAYEEVKGSPGGG
ncbi:MAG: pyruvate synthase [Thermoproteota archaeon]|nr:MAG: pyruvate synthase [Candidatus Korarchaeota archaeon]